MDEVGEGLLAAIERARAKAAEALAAIEAGTERSGRVESAVRDAEQALAGLAAKLRADA